MSGLFRFITVVLMTSFYVVCGFNRTTTNKKIEQNYFARANTLTDVNTDAEESALERLR